jgi:large subunit ribosomal protein L21
MAKIAVIKTGGKQYKVAEGDKLKIEKIKAEENSEFIFDQVLLVSADDKGKDLKIGAPLVEGAKVTVKVLSQDKGPKTRVVKYKNKTRYYKVYGHKQPFTQVQISKIS